MWSEWTWLFVPVCLASLLYASSNSIIIVTYLLFSAAWCFFAWSESGLWDERDHSPDNRVQPSALRRPTPQPSKVPEVPEISSEVDQTIGTVEVPVQKASIPLAPLASVSIEQALKRVFDCSYSECVLSWYKPPELSHDQPLHQTLLTEFDKAVEHSVAKVRNLDPIRVEQGLIQILTDHLRAIKREEKREVVFQNRQQELTLLRKCSKTLVCNLLPDSVWRVDCYQRLLEEIIAVKLVEPFVNLAYEPDFINQVLIDCLDKDFTPKPKVKAQEPCTTDSTPNTEESKPNVVEFDAGKRNKKHVKPKWIVKLHKLFMKRSRKCRKNLAASSTIFYPDEVDGESGISDSQFRCISSSNLESDSKATDSSEDQENLTSLQEDEIPEDVLLSDTLFDSLSACGIHMEKSKLEAILTWMMSGESNEDDGEVGVEDEDRVEDEDNEAIDEDMMTEADEEEDGSSHSEDQSKIHSDGAANADCEIPADSHAELVEDGGDETTGSQCDNSTSDVQSREGFDATDQESEEEEQGSVASFENADLEVNNECGFRALSSPTENADVDFPDSDSDVDGRKRKKKQKFLKKMISVKQPECTSKCLFQLLMEIFNGEQFATKVIRSSIQFEFIQKALDTWFHKKLCHEFAKDRMIYYLDSLREKLWPNGKPAKSHPERTSAEKLETKAKAEVLVSTFKVQEFNVLPKEDMKALFSKFQNAEINKHLLYRLLLFLLFEINPVGKDAWNNETLPCLKILNVDELKTY